MENRFPRQTLTQREVERQFLTLLRKNRERIEFGWTANQTSPEILQRFGVSMSESVQDVRRRFIRPLLQILESYVASARSELHQVYLDERLRFAPHQEDPSIRRAFFSDLLARDLESLHALPTRTGGLDWLDELWARLHRRLLAPVSGPQLRLLALGDCLLNEIRVFLPSQLAAEAVSLDMRCLYFSAAVGTAARPETVVKFLSRFEADVISASFLSYEGLPMYRWLMREVNRLPAAEITSRIELMMIEIRGFIGAIREHTDVPILLHNVSGLPLSGLWRVLPFVQPLTRPARKALDSVNAQLAELAEVIPSIVLVDEREVAKRNGYRRCQKAIVARRISHEAYLGHTARFGHLLAAEYARVLRAFAKLHKVKVIAVDFDNTLWEGVMADGVVAHHADRQQLLRRLRQAGILLIAVSKNDPASIRWEEMRLEERDFILLKISWDLKAKSLREAAEVLNLGLDAFVMIDDNPVERQLVQQELPSVQVFDAMEPET